MCFGTFHSKGGLCTNCKVIRSCKRESLKRINDEQKKQAIQKIKNNTIERYGPKAKTILLLFINQCTKPQSTYGLTKEFKKYYQLNVSDTKILQLCKELHAEGRIKLFLSKKGRYWYHN